MKHGENVRVLGSIDHGILSGQFCPDKLSDLSSIDCRPEHEHAAYSAVFVKIFPPFATRSNRYNFTLISYFSLVSVVLSLIS